MARPAYTNSPLATGRCRHSAALFGATVFVAFALWQAAVFHGTATSGDRPLTAQIAQPPTISGDSIPSQCLKGKWLYFYGDSLVRGYFLDVVRAQGLLRSPSPVEADMGSWKAQLSPPEEDCREHTTTYWGKKKCVFWEYSSKTPGAEGWVRLTYRAKFSVYNSTVDDPIIEGIFPESGNDEGGRVPDALVTSSGFWDMLWENDDGAYMKGLARYLALVRRRYEGVVLWPEVTCTNEDLLAGSKRERMTCARALEYNRASRPVLERHGVAIVPAHEVTKRHPSETRDGIHFPGFVSRSITCGILNSGVCPATQENTCPI